MLKSDHIIGFILCLFAALVLWHASHFPRLAGLAYGPDLFPSIAALGLLLCGGVIALTAQNRPRPVDQQHGQMHAAASNGRQTAWRKLCLVVVVAAYAVLLEPLGFHLATPFALLIAAALFGLGWVHALLLAVILTFVTHALFYSLLGVPLPWGLLTSVAW